MIQHAGLNAVAVNDRRAFILKVAEHLYGAEAIAYYAIQAFYDSPSYKKARCIESTVVGRNAPISLNIKSDTVDLIHRITAAWGEHVDLITRGQAGRFTPPQLANHRATLYDYAWSDVNGHHASWYGDLEGVMKTVGGVGLPLASANAEDGYDSGRRWRDGTVKVVLSTLERGGIVI